MPAIEHRRRRASRQHHCPICDHGDWCLIGEDDAICMRTPSDHPVDCGGAGQGWLHKLGSSLSTLPPLPKTAPVPRPVADWDAWLANASRNTPQEQIASMAADLGVSMASLARLGFCWSAAYWSAAFPMRDSAGSIIGVRLRSNDGRKWAVTGSRAGLFIPDGDPPDQLTTLWVCEGPTDCAALLDLGIYPIGRPSCSGGVDMILPLVIGRNLIVMADADAPKERPDGSTWRPGADGAEALAGKCAGKARTVKIIYPLAGKDVREWKRLGATPELLRAVERNTAYWRRK